MVSQKLRVQRDARKEKQRIKRLNQADERRLLIRAKVMGMPRQVAVVYLREHGFTGVHFVELVGGRGTEGGRGGGVILDLNFDLRRIVLFMDGDIVSRAEIG